MRGIKAVTCYYPTCAECGRDEDDINSCSDGVTHLNTPEEARKWWTDIDLGSDDGRLLCWECHYAERAERERLDDLRNRFGDITCRGCGKEHPGEDCPHSEPLPIVIASTDRQHIGFNMDATVCAHCHSDIARADA